MPLDRFASILGKAENFFANENYNDCVNVVGQILASNPNHFDAVYLKAKALRRLDKNQESIPFFNHALALNPAYTDTYQELTMALVGCGDYNQANMIVDRAMQINPNDFDTVNNKGLLIF